MKRLIPITILFLILCLDKSFAQCHWQDTGTIHRTRIKKPYAIAISNDGKVAVSTVRRDSVGKLGAVTVWNNVTKFMEGFRPSDSFKVIAPQGLTYDHAGNLYVVQSERPDSNILVYNPSLALIKVIDNEIGPAHWYNPRGIAIDNAQNLYVISSDTIGAFPGDTTAPGTGKLVKITSPLSSAVKSVLLSDLNAPKGVTIAGGYLYLSEYGAGKIRTYDLSTMNPIDSVTQADPVDMFVNDCRLYTTQHSTNSVLVYNSSSLNSSTPEVIARPPSNRSKLGVQLDASKDLFICDNDSARVIFFRGVIPASSGGGGGILGGTYCMGTHALISIGSGGYWTSNDTSVVTIDSAGNAYFPHNGSTYLHYHTGATDVLFLVFVDTPLPTLVGDIYADGDPDRVYFSDTVCYLNVLQLACDSFTGSERWISDDVLTANVDERNGLVWPVKPGEVDIRLERYNACGVSDISFHVYIIGRPDIGDILGDTVICHSGTLSLSNSVTGGRWSSGNDTIASVDTASGWVTAHRPGVVGVTYMTFNSCDEAYRSVNIHVDSTPVAGAISGPDSVCKNASISLSDTAGTQGGYWTSSDTSVAQVDTLSGVVTGISAGAATISYTVKNSCDTLSAAKSIRVIGLPHITSLTAASPDVCPSHTDSLFQDDTVGTKVWRSSDDSRAVVSAGGIVTGIAHGTATITVVTSNSCSADSATIDITIDSQFVAGTIVGPDSICAQNTTLFTTSGTAGGKWYSLNSFIASVDSLTGIVTANHTGTAVIQYRVGNNCDTVTASKSVYVKDKPLLSLISGPSSVCEGADILLSATATGDGPLVTSWASSGPSATVAGGNVHGVILGSATIYFIAQNVCGIDTAAHPLTVNPLPVAGVITGSASVCVGVTTVLSHGTTTGTGSWNSSSSSIATVNAAGTVGGAAQGNATISFTATNSCGSSTTLFSMTVNPQPVAGSVSGPSEGCIGSDGVYTASGSVGAGTWSSDNSAVLSISAGVASYSGDGTANIIYTATNSCGFASTSYPVTVLPVPYAAPISGNTDVCQDWFTDFLSAPGSVGDYVNWFTNAPSVVDIDYSTGQVFYNGPGSATVFLGMSNSCGYSESYLDITVTGNPVAGIITGPDSVCFGATISLTPVGASDPGYWYSDNYSVAGVDASGVVTGTSATPASSTIYYHVDNMCGYDEAAHLVGVRQSPLTGTITGPSSVCVGSTVSLGGVLPGGVWSSDATSVATVSASGVVGGSWAFGSSATTTITYSMSSYSCGSAYTTAPMTVYAQPSHGFITGTDTLCMNAFDTLRNHSATPGGTWRSRQHRVTFTSAVAGVDTVALQGTSAGVDTVVYTVNTLCGTDSALFHIVINHLPLDGAVVGPASVCVGSSIFLSDPTGTPGGAWSSSDPALATVDPVTGFVYGVSNGPVVITYSGNTSCGYILDPYNITVNPSPVAVISPAINNVCVGSNVTLDPSGSIGVQYWNSSNTFVATVDGSTGMVGGVSAGNSTITLITQSSYCGLDTAVLNITVNPLPHVGPITGADSVCYGANIFLSDTTLGGIWTTASGVIASVSSSGVVTGNSITLSSTSITYTITSPTCGSIAATHMVTVKPLPSAGVLSGPASECVGSAITLSSTVPGGAWSSLSSLVSVDPVSGAVTGISAGTATVTYTVTNDCGTATATWNVTISTVPGISAIAGPDSVCVGATIVETASPALGSWGYHFGYVSITSASPASATFYGLSGGVDTITYTVVNACGISTVSKPVFIKALPDAGYIVAGADSLCPGNVTTLTNPSGTPGGVWSHTGTNINLTAGGSLTAMFTGTDTVKYTVSNSCGTATAAHLIVVNPLPVVGAITGPVSVCIGNSITLANTTGTPGGTWACGTGGTITSSGVFTGVTAGMVTVSYAATTQCGTLYSYYIETVNPLPVVSAITGPMSVCIGSAATLSDATTPGFWSVSPAGIATINTSTGVYGGVAAGSATVSYSVSNLCGTTTVIAVVTVNTLPAVSSILGIATLCPGATSTLYSGPSGGVWSASNAHATISASGLLTGVTPGVDTITYTVTNSCGASHATRISTVDALPAADSISGPAVACIGMPVTLTIGGSGGTWSASNANATVSGGIVTGVSAGVDTIYCFESNSCGMATMTRIMTVYPSVAPSVSISITPGDTVCGAAPVTLTATPVNGGPGPYLVWMNGSSLIGTGTTLSWGPSDGDVLYCTMASSAICPTADTVHSDSITMHVFPNVIPVVNVTVSPSDTITYIGEELTFTATLANCGSYPAYQWYENGTAIAGATNATYTTTAVGGDAYYCIAACDSVCAVAVYNHSNVVTLYTGLVNVQDMTSNSASYSVAPNPNTGSFVLDGHGITSSGGVRYDVLDVAGREVFSGAALPDKGHIHKTISLDSVVSGQYILRVFDGNTVLVFRVDIMK